MRLLCPGMILFVAAASPFHASGLQAQESTAQELTEGASGESTSMESQIRRSTLSSGGKVVLLPSHDNGNMVHGSIGINYGDMQSLTDRSMTSRLLLAILRDASSGEGSDIAHHLEALDARVYVYSGIDGLLVNFRAPGDHLTVVVDLVARLLRSPPIDESSTWKVIQNAVPASGRTDRIASEVVDSNIARRYGVTSSGHPCQVATPREALAAILDVTAEDLESFHKEFYGSGNGIFSFVGDFDPESLHAQLEDLFGDWRSPRSYTPLVCPVHPVTGVKEWYPVPGNMGDYTKFLLMLPISENDSDFASLLVASHILGGDPESSRTRRALKQAGVLQVNPSSSFTSGAVENQAVLTVDSSSDPAVTRLVASTIRKAISKMVTHGVTNREVESAVDALLRKRERDQENYEELANVLLREALYGFSRQRSADLNRRLSTLTASEVTAAIRRHLKPEDISEFGAGSAKSE